MQELIAELEARLSGFPTTEKEDEEILAKEDGKLDWISHRVIDFRRERKTSLRLAIERLKEREKIAYSLLSSTTKASAGKEEL